MILSIYCPITQAIDYTFSDYQKRQYELAVKYLKQNAWVASLECFNRLIGSIENDFGRWRDIPEDVKDFIMEVRKGLYYCEEEIEHALKVRERLKRYGNEMKITYYSGGKMDTDKLEQKTRVFRIPKKDRVKYPRLRRRLK
jgi:archaellum component FlaC